MTMKSTVYMDTCTVYYSLDVFVVVEQYLVI